MALTTRINNGGAIIINGVRLTFDKCTQVCIHSPADIIVIKPNGAETTISRKQENTNG